MITVNDLSLQFGGTVLFSRVDLKFTPGNCYGVIGANGAGKSTFLKILSGELEPTGGTVEIKKDVRMSVLKQDQFMYDEYPVMDTVIMGNMRLYECGKEKDAIYEKPDFDDADGIRAAELEEEFAELGGWEAESNASQLLQGLGIPTDLHQTLMRDMDPRQKVKVLLAQTLFGEPDVVLLDEPTNNLDLESVVWLEDFLMDYSGTVIVVSHDRYFLNNVCTHIVDIDYGKIKMYVGNYDFWYDSSQLMQKLIKDKNRKAEEKIAELEEFIRRFSANKSKSRQATSRRKLLDKITIEEMPASSRKYPWVGFTMAREPGKDRLFVTDVSKTVDGVKILDNVSFIMNKDDKIALLGESEIAVTEFYKLLAGETEPDSGTIKWGVSTTQAYFPKDNSRYFDGCDDSIMDWIRQFSEDKRESYLRTFLGRMLFTGDDVYKPVKVLSGGEKVRCMLSKMMLSGASILLFDQPTNHLDLESIAALNNGMSDFKGNIIFTTHDHQLTQTVANRIIEIKDGKLIDRKMTYDEYIGLEETQSRIAEARG
ncbi:MAG: ATP-binding cassette domain-containing protein [Oscillospiraceae bacterium]|nr:ATP-binding cassette domain-containing protein [Oscillospiraceae bacterium]